MKEETYNSLLRTEDKIGELGRHINKEINEVLKTINYIIPDNRKLFTYLEKIKAEHSTLNSERYKGFLIACHLIEDYSKLK